jgi:hypothetical protein
MAAVSEPGRTDLSQLPGTSQIELVQGDLFDSDAAYLVVPCSSDGNVTGEVRTRLDDMRVDRLSGIFTPGQVIPAPSKRRGARHEVLYAVVVPADLATTPEMVDRAAREVAAIVPAGGSVAFPLLGTGSGGLDDLVSLQAIVNGFGSTAAPQSHAAVHVLDPLQFDRLSILLGSALSADPTPTESTSSTPTETTSTAPPERTSTATTKTTSTTPTVARPNTRREIVPTHTDGPARIDELGREGFARVIARRIKEARREEARNATRLNGRKGPNKGGSFLVHLHAPWGAGKTSVLNLLAAELRKEDPAANLSRCVVVQFNAWSHQRIDPPWWWLMTTLYRDAARELGGRRAAWLRIREWWWRVKGGMAGYLALVAVAVIAVLVWRTGWLGALGGEDLLSADAVRGLVLTVAAIISPVLTIWGLLHGFGRWALAASARGAKRFVANTSDPLKVVQDHLSELTRWIEDDVVILIDDLDRCRGPYVVELLEGIQTLFRDVPITYVVAADRDWLADSYSTEYADFSSSTSEPGKPVGYLFLEKTFQISTGLPQARAQLSRYWNRILRSAALPGDDDLGRARVRATQELAGQSPEQARRSVLADPGSTPAEVQARREAVAVEMVNEQAQTTYRHLLEPFQALLGRDPNPRMMKRLVNAYGIARGIETLQGINLEDDRAGEEVTALWTVLTLRWPLLAAHLGRFPEHVGLIGSRPAEVPESVRSLFDDPDVVAVVRGDARGIEAELTDDRIRALALP